MCLKFMLDMYMYIFFPMKNIVYANIEPIFLPRSGFKSKMIVSNLSTKQKKKNLQDSSENAPFNPLFTASTVKTHIQCPARTAV